jgi:hypothetical protein
MRRKLTQKTDPVVPAEVLEQANLAISTDRITNPCKCSVCGDETLGMGAEPLCWVCRRLKISAWREIEQQMPVQE